MKKNKHVQLFQFEDFSNHNNSDHTFTSWVIALIKIEFYRTESLIVTFNHILCDT
jgi:hypothetical protein